MMSASNVRVSVYERVSEYLRAMLAPTICAGARLEGLVQ